MSTVHGVRTLFAKFKKTFQIFELTPGTRNNASNRRTWISFGTRMYVGGNNTQTERKIDVSGSFVNQLMNHTKTYNLHQNHYPNAVTRIRKLMEVLHMDRECE